MTSKELRSLTLTKILRSLYTASRLLTPSLVAWQTPFTLIGVRIYMAIRGNSIF
ncbi:hypothetical protein [Lacticaseibacillus paracasei]|uniref:hypothetical protein n=1 Tax=Lacticaseibacillus paracasei TaxID=1597 RepID=UPI00155A5196|nr:hypothetical protein [Lacticaseibacillus paracasei]